MIILNQSFNLGKVVKNSIGKFAYTILIFCSMVPSISLSLTSDTTNQRYLYYKKNCKAIALLPLYSWSGFRGGGSTRQTTEISKGLGINLNLFFTKRFALETNFSIGYTTYGNAANRIYGYIPADYTTIVSNISFCYILPINCKKKFKWLTNSIYIIGGVGKGKHFISPNFNNTAQKTLGINLGYGFNFVPWPRKNKHWQIIAMKIFPVVPNYFSSLGFSQVGYGNLGVKYCFK